MRIAATDPRCPEWQKHLFPCDADDHEWLYLSWWQEDDYPGYLEVTETAWAPSLWGRIKGSVKVLFGRRQYFSGVLLDSETTDHLIETLTEYRTEKRPTSSQP